MLYNLFLEQFKNLKIDATHTHTTTSNMHNLLPADCTKSHLLMVTEISYSFMQLLSFHMSKNSEEIWYTLLDTCITIHMKISKHHQILPLDFDCQWNKCALCSLWSSTKYKLKFKHQISGKDKNSEIQWLLSNNMKNFLST